MTNKIGWVARDWSMDVHNWHPTCETPKHVSSGIRAVWVMALIEAFPHNEYVQGMCQSCMELIARGLGTTPEEGRMDKNGA